MAWPRERPKGGMAGTNCAKIRTSCDGLSGLPYLGPRMSKSTQLHGIFCSVIQAPALHGPMSRGGFGGDIFLLGEGALAPAGRPWFIAPQAACPPEGRGWNRV